MESESWILVFWLEAIIILKSFYVIESWEIYWPVTAVDSVAPPTWIWPANLTCHLPVEPVKYTVSKAIFSKCKVFFMLHKTDVFHNKMFLSYFKMCHF